MYDWQKYLKLTIMSGMEYLKESNKNLISLRTSLIAVVAWLTGGLVGMIYSDIDLGYKILPILLGFILMVYLFLT